MHVASVALNSIYYSMSNFPLSILLLSSSFTKKGPKIIPRMQPIGVLKAPIAVGMALSLAPNQHVTSFETPFPIVG